MQKLAQYVLVGTLSHFNWRVLEKLKKKLQHMDQGTPQEDSNWITVIEHNSEKHGNIGICP